MLAAFASSPSGRLFGRSCERYGVDPGLVLSDDVMAFNLRVALALSDQTEEIPEETGGYVNPDLYEQMKAASGR